ncbi:branched-chain amino acid transport system substrate-binding protein [Variovorax sp. HW608]|uniref:branched-chain amino acid ABC transporter substrate-binding protein n=1 Tax=Variovorax sp. HW608 TaxID=1034889 RepID=UPI00081FB47F|nr:branched-chain amino acid ABC transporter substrate-binding protein [Variovorax sp. HW608]SCK10251.1 branched-chain amino acid transport system substrate-binding protein [Variovorax sp. HW608]
MRFNLIQLAVVAVMLTACGDKKDTPVASGAPSVPSATPAAAKPSESITVRIGHAAPTSGPAAHLGKDDELGARMAIDELNAKGIKLGGKLAKFELLAEDDASDPKQATAVAQKLADQGVNGVIGHAGSGTSIPASRIYADAGIPQISPSATNPKFTRQGFKTTFRVVADDTQLGGALGRYAVKDMQGKRIAIVDDRTAYGQGVAEEFKKAVEAAGGHIVGYEFTTDKATDFNAILTKLKGAQPDILFFGGLDAVAGPMLRQTKQLGMAIRFMGGDGLCTGELAKLAGDAIGEGTVVCAEAGGVEGELKGPLEKFKTDFKAKNGVDVQIYAPYVYDAVNVMAAAMQQADSSDPNVYLPKLKTIQYNGITGPISFDEKGDIKGGALTLYTYKSGARTQLATIR